MPKFSFGANWAEYARAGLTEDRIKAAELNLLEMLELPSLEGLSFVDVGSGSGIHSLAALRSGATKVVSFDVDEKSVATTQQVSEAVGRPEQWMITTGSVLDRNFLATLGSFDIVYSWGVLHHTGQLWLALENAITLLKPGGRLFIALYVTGPKSGFWLKVKQTYNTVPAVGQRLMEYVYIVAFVLHELVGLRNPFQYISNYQRNRGMSFLTDVKDWLGGLPYEPSRIDEIVRFMRKRALRLDNIRTGHECVEYVLSR
jgi:SAM-dependent methyltransferase